tara:strand:+ start:13492 stop:21543 length:8052 start_codon:yes stop_codon:yes gene_type:complete
MYKNSQGETVSAEQMQTWADANGMSIGEYAALAGYTLSNETEIEEVDAGKINGVETPEKKTTSVAAPSRASMIAGITPEDTELSLDDTSSELQETNEKFFGKTPSKDISSLEIAEKALREISLSEEDRNKLFEKAGQTYTTSEAGYMVGAGMPMQPTLITKNNYDPFVEDAKKLIAESSNNDYDLYSVPKSEWETKAKELYVEEEEKKLFQKNVETVLDTYEDNVFGAWYSPARIAKAFNSFNPGGVRNSLTETETEYLVGRAKLTSTFEQESEAATGEYKSSIEVIKTHAPIVQTTAAYLNRLETQFNNSPETITQADVTNYNSLLNTYKTAEKILSTQYGKLGDLESTASTTAGLADMTRRTYNTLDVVENRLASATVNAAAGIGNVLFELSPQQVIKRISGYNTTEDGDLPVYLRSAGILSLPTGTKAFKDGVDSLWAQADEVNKYTQKRQELGEINDLGDFGEFMIDLFSEQAINTAITVGTGGAGLVAISASAAGSKFHEMELEMENIPGLNYTAAQFYGTGFVYGASEYITESVSLGQAKGLLKRFGLGANNFKKAYKIDGGYTLETLSKSKAYLNAAKRWGINTNKEGGAEGLVQVFNNVADKYFLGKDVAITDNVGESYVTGALMSGLGFNAPVLLADLAVAFKTDSKIGEYNDRTKKIIDIRKNLNTVLKNSDMENDTAAQQTAATLQSEIDELLTDNLLGMKQDIEVLENLERNDKQQLIDLDSQIYKRKRGIDKINNNPKLDSSIKKDLISKLQLEISIGNTQKNIILTSNQNSKQKKDVANFQTELTVKTGKVMHVANGETISQAVENGIKIVNEAEADGKLEPEVAKKIIGEINRAGKEGGNANGFQIGADVGFPMNFSVDETLIKNGMGATVLHEAGHATVLSALLGGNADVLGIVSEMESYVTTRFKGAKEIFANIEKKYSDKTQEYIAEEKLAALLDFRPDLGKMDKTTAGKILSFWDKIKPFGKNQEITSIKTGADVYNLMSGFARSFDKGQVSDLAAKVIKGEVKAVQKKAVEVSKEVNKKTTSFSLGNPKEFSNNDKADLFSTANKGFNEAAELYGLNIKFNDDGTPAFTKAEWDAVDENTKLGLGFLVGENFRPYVNYLMGSRRDVPGFDELADQIIDRASTGLEKGDDGIPFLIKTYDPSKGTKLTTHIFGQVSRRLQGVINKTEGFGEITVEAAPTESNKRELVSEETADSNIKTEERGKAEGKKKKFDKITDEVIVLDNDGKATTISEKVATEVKSAVKVVYATTKFKNEIGTKGYRTELVNALRNKLGNLFKSIMDRGVNYNNDSKVGNKEKRANYDAFVDSNFKSVYSIMPKSTISDRFPFLMEPVLNEDGTPYFMSAAEVDAYNDALDRGEIRGKRIANKYAGNKVFKKRPYDAQVKKEGTEYLKANDKATNVRNARKTSFADVVAEEAALDILPEVLRENGYEKEAAIEQIEQQIGRANFSIGNLTDVQESKFQNSLPIFAENLRTNKRSYSTANVTAIFNAVYNPSDFGKKAKGIIKQFVDQLSPFNKKGVKISKEEKFFKDFVDKITSQADQTKNLVDLVYDGDVSMASLFRGKIDEATGKDVRVIARGEFVEFGLNMKEEIGVEKTIQNLISFGNPTFNSSGVSGVAEVYNPITGKYIKNPIRKTKAYDLFTKNQDFLENVLQKIDPTIVSFTRSTVTRKVKGKKAQQVEQITHVVENTVTKDTAKNISNNTYDNTKQNETAEAAKEFVISTLKYIATVEDPAIRAVLTANLNDGSKNALRAAAKVTNTADGYFNLDPTKYRYEHLLASRNALGLAYDYYVNGNKSIDIDAMWNDYQVAIVPKTMDSAVNKAGFAYTSYAGYVPGVSSIFERYYNIFTMGKVQYALRSIDGKTIVGKNFADFYKENGGKTTVNKNIVEDMTKYEASVKEKEVTVKEASFSKGKLSTEFNSIIERDKGVESYKTFSKMVARRRGARAGRFKYWMPSSLDDFKGLTSYTFSGKGKQGDADQKFFNDNLINPYFAGIRAIETSRQTFKSDITGLNKMFKPTVKKLGKLTPDGDYTYDQAIRVYLWTKSGFEIDGLSKRDAKKLIELVEADESMTAYADGLQLISKREKWVKPSEYWDAETLLSDLNNMTEKEGRKAYLEEFIENADAIFSDDNLYKIEALYGTKHADALRDILYRMKNGTNRPSGSNKNVNKFNNWLNNSIGAIMFFNRRSALLQTLSTANFINWSDNNPAKAALAFANQPQFWKDFARIFNSDMLKQRRSGLKSDVSEAEIATAAQGAKNKASAVLSYLLKIGFTPTQMADSFAIASGGATFYRNRINSLKKKGMDQAEAEAQAFVDFSNISEETQQSGDPALISSDQASVLGRVLLSFQNTPIQLNRSIKKAAQDIYNRRRRPGQTQMQSDLGNVSKIIYYGTIQNLIFSALQNALFALIPGFGDEDDALTEEEQIAKYGKIVTTKQTRMINGMVDTTLKGGFGLPGAVVATIKNVVMEYNKQEEKGFLSDHAYTILQAANLAPPVGSKLRKIYTAIQTNKFEKDAIKQRGLDVTINGEFNLSPAYSVVGNVLEGGLNIPMARLVDEVNSVTEALDARNSSMQRLALGLGWKTWDVSARNEEHDLIKTQAKAKRKEEGIEKAKESRATNKKENERIKEAVLESFTKAETEKWLELPRKEEKAFIEKIAKEKGIK